MAYSGLSGQYGLMPMTALRQKYEVTALDENPHATENHNRSVLKDLRCDAPFFESDQKKDTRANEFLSLRFNAHRSGDIPDRPDDFFELTGRDPRGRTTDPRMDKAREQMMSRAPQYRWGPEEDNFVAESPKPPQLLIQQMGAVFGSIKARLKIFATSQDGMQQSRKQFTDEPASRVDTSESSSAQSSIVDMQLHNDATTILSNITPSGWDRVTDNVFKVASYGATNSGLEGFQGKRVETKQDAAATPGFKTQLAHAALAKQMAQVLTKQVGTDSKYAQAHDQSSQHAAMQKSAVLAGAGTTEEKMRVAKFADLATKSRELQTANSSHRHQELMTTKVETMHLATSSRRLVDEKMLDQHKAIIASARTVGNIPDLENKSARTRERNDYFLSDKSARWTESLKTAPLAALIKHKAQNNLSTAEGYKKQSREQSQRAPAETHNAQDHFTSSNQQTTRNTDGIIARFKGSMGKRTRTLMVTDRPTGLNS